MPACGLLKMYLLKVHKAKVPAANKYRVAHKQVVCAVKHQRLSWVHFIVANCFHPVSAVTNANCSVILISMII